MKIYEKYNEFLEKTTNSSNPFVKRIQYPVGQGGLHYSVINLGDRILFIYMIVAV